MVCLSAGSDACFKVWDLSARKCVQTYGGHGNENLSVNVKGGGGGPSSNSLQSRSVRYHKDAILSMDVLFESDVAFTGGRDGSIYSNRIVKTHYEKIYQEPSKDIITSLKFDEANNYLWYSTPESEINCLKYLQDLTNQQDSDIYYPEPNDVTVKPHMVIKGKLFEYCVANN